MGFDDRGWDERAARDGGHLLLCAFVRACAGGGRQIGCLAMQLRTTPRMAIKNNRTSLPQGLEELFEATASAFNRKEASSLGETYEAYVDAEEVKKRRLENCLINRRSSSGRTIFNLSTNGQRQIDATSLAGRKGQQRQQEARRSKRKHACRSLVNQIIVLFPHHFRGRRVIGNRAPISFSIRHGPQSARCHMTSTSPLPCLGALASALLFDEDSSHGISNSLVLLVEHGMLETLVSIMILMESWYPAPNIPQTRLSFYITHVSFVPQSVVAQYSRGSVSRVCMLLGNV